MNYDPFVKEDFILPEKWYVSVTNETFKDINIFKNKTCWKDNAIDYKIIGYEGVGYNSPPNDYIKITFEQFKKYVLKESIETPKEVIPEYVECIKVATRNTKIGEIFKCRHCNGSFEFEYNDKSGISYNSWDGWSCVWEDELPQKYFKPSTKEAFDAQNQPKTIEKWSVGSYFVIEKDELYSISSSKRGDICLIKENGNFNFINKKDTTNWSFDLREGSSWFATKSEAEEFAKTLVEPVKKEIKQPLKQAVHCKTQEEWDFVTEKLGYKWAQHCSFSAFGKSTCISLIDTQYSYVDYLKNDYQILSFQEWCDLNGYKMEKEVKFEAGKWYSIKTCYDWIIKFKGLNNDRLEASWCCINKPNKKVEEGGVWDSKPTEIKELSLEEIQQYLPDNHPDKIKVDREFKVIPDTSGKYEINRSGIVRNAFTKKELATSLSTRGYLKVNLWLNEKNNSPKIHRLLAKTFLENPYNLESINHKDGNKLNNNLDNLEWCTLQENNEHYKNTVGTFNSDLEREEILDIYFNFNKYGEQKQAAIKYGVSEGCISLIKNGISFKHIIDSATPEEINNHLISIGQIPAGEPLNTGIELDKNSMFKYTVICGSSLSGCTTQNHSKALILKNEIIKSAIEFNYLPEPR